MSIVNPGEKLPAAYLERFDPAENVTYRFSVLSTSAIAIESHWLDVPSKNIAGSYQCLQGACCMALGRRRQSYNIPIYVYRQNGSTEGDIYVLNMTPARWKKFSDLALQIDLLQYDLVFSAQKRGQGMDWSYSAMPDYKYRDYWTAEQREQLDIAVKSFYQIGESSLVNPMNANDWAQLLYDIGYDLQNQCWPGGQSPLNSGSAFGAIRGAVGAGSMLPPPPPSGYSQVQSAGHVVANGIGSGVVLQPHQLQAAPANVIPQAAAFSPGLGPPINPSGTVNRPQIVQQQPVSQVIAGGGNGGGYPTPPAVAPVTPAAPAHVPVVPLGTAPNVPSVSQGATPPMNGVPNIGAGVVSALANGAGGVPPQQNIIQTQLQEITSEELNAMLSG